MKYYDDYMIATLFLEVTGQAVANFLQLKIISLPSVPRRCHHFEAARAHPVLPRTRCYYHRRCPNLRHIKIELHPFPLRRVIFSELE